MSEAQISSLLDKIQEDAELRGKLDSVFGDPDAAIALAQQAGFDVDKDDWLQYQELIRSCLSYWRNRAQSLPGDWGGYGTEEEMRRSGMC